MPLVIGLLKQLTPGNLNLPRNLRLRERQARRILSQKKISDNPITCQKTLLKRLELKYCLAINGLEHMGLLSYVDPRGPDDDPGVHVVGVTHWWLWC